MFYPSVLTHPMEDSVPVIYLYKIWKPIWWLPRIQIPFILFHEWSVQNINPLHFFQWKLFLQDSSMKSICIKKCPCFNNGRLKRKVPVILWIHLVRYVWHIFFCKMYSIMMYQLISNVHNLCRHNFRGICVVCSLWQSDIQGSDPLCQSTEMQ